MTAPSWKHPWPSHHMMHPPHRPEICDDANEFLKIHRLPRSIHFEARGANASMGFEWLFEPLNAALRPYNRIIKWGDFFDAKEDKLWSEQLEIGEERFLGGCASICVHAQEGYITRLDCEVEGAGWFVNGSLPLFGESLFTLVSWADRYQSGEKLDWRAAQETLLEALERVDPRVRHDKDEYRAFWPTLLKGYFDDGETIVSCRASSEPSNVEW